MDRKVNSNKAKFRHQLAAGQYGLLFLTGLTLINLLLLLLGVEYHFLLSAAAPYYANWLCVKLDAGAFVRVLAVLLALAAVIFYGACWLMSHRRWLFLTAALAGYLLDTLLLVIFAFALLENPASCVIEILTHLAMLGLLLIAEQAAGAMQRLRRRSRMGQPV